MTARQRPGEEIEAALAFLNEGAAILRSAGGRDRSLPWLRDFAREAGALRRAGLRLLEARGEGEGLPRPAFEVVERALRAGIWRRRAATDDNGGPAVIERLANPEYPLAQLSATATALVTLVSATDPARVRRCAAPECARWFHDRSRNGRRKWCSMETCGNRAKAARFRARHAREPEAPAVDGRPTGLRAGAPVSGA